MDFRSLLHPCRRFLGKILNNVGKFRALLLKGFFHVEERIIRHVVVLFGFGEGVCELTTVHAAEIVFHLLDLGVIHALEELV